MARQERGSSGRTKSEPTAAAKRWEEDKNRFLLAAEALRDMPMEDRIQLLVEAGLMEQSEADEVKLRCRQKAASRDKLGKQTRPNRSGRSTLRD